MVRAGMSLPALMHLMGHADIQTTMLYVQLAPEDVWREYAPRRRPAPPFVHPGENLVKRAQPTLDQRSAASCNGR